MSTPTYEPRDGAAWIHLDDGKANVLRSDVFDMLCGHLDRASVDQGHAIVFRGRDGFFSAGLDLGWLSGLDGDGLVELDEVFSATMLRILASPSWPATCPKWTGSGPTPPHSLPG